MSEIIGKVLDRAKTDSFSFVSTKSLSFDTKFVEVKVDENLKLIGEIIEKEAINPYFERPEDIRYIDEKAETITARSLYVARVKPLAMVKDGRHTEVLSPPLPGANVFIAEEADIKIALELEDKGIDIGFLKGYNLPIRISHDKLLRTHISILGQTGSGKSYLAAKIAVELLKLRHNANVPSQIAVPIIFDSSGEYSEGYDLGKQNELSRIMKSISIKDHYFPLLNKKYLPLLYDIYDVKEKQESELRIWFLALVGNTSADEIRQEAQMEILNRQDVRQLINEFSQIRITSTEQLANYLEDYIKKFNQLQTTTEKISIPYNVTSRMRRYNLKIKKTDDMDIIGQLSDGLIVNLSEQKSYEMRQITLLLFLRQLYEAAEAKKLNSRVVLFIEEAHNYVPSIYRSFCKEEILRLAREGRKYGITLCLISQRPRWVDPTALSQCGNVFIFRIQNSDDKKHIFDSASLPDTLKDINIARFKTGEMIVTGDVINHPMHCVVSQLDRDFISLVSSKVKDEAIKNIRTFLK